MLQYEDNVNATILIRKDLLQTWRLTENELLNLAMENLRNSQMDFSSITEKVLTVTSLDDIEMPFEKNIFTPIYIATNLANHYGASVIMDDEKLKQIAQMIKDDFYIIPSSIHEVFCVPMYVISDQAFLQQILININQTKVAPEEVLEWHIYCYHADKREIPHYNYINRCRHC